MPDEIVPQEASTQRQEEPAGLEADMDRLAGEIMRHKEVLEHEPTDHKELLKQAIRAIAPHDGGSAPASGTQPQTDSPYVPAYAAGAAPEVKLEIEYLVDLALREGIGKANAAARKSNPFILDAFHDALAGKLYPELQRRNIVP